MTTLASYFITTGANEQATLPPGTEGQTKLLVMEDGALGSMYVTVENHALPGIAQSQVGQLVFAQDGVSATLTYIHNKWYVVGNNGVTFEEVANLLPEFRLVVSTSANYKDTHPFFVKVYFPPTYTSYTGGFGGTGVAPYNYGGIYRNWNEIQDTWDAIASNALPGMGGHQTNYPWALKSVYDAPSALYAQSAMTTMLAQYQAVVATGIYPTFLISKSTTGGNLYCSPYIDATEFADGHTITIYGSDANDWDSIPGGFSFANGVAATILARTLVNNNTQISILQIATSSGLTTKNIDPLTNRFIRKT